MFIWNDETTVRKTGTFGLERFLPLAQNRDGTIERFPNGLE